MVCNRYIERMKKEKVGCYDKKCKLLVSDEACRLLLHCLVELRNTLIREGRHTDFVKVLFSNTHTPAPLTWNQAVNAGHRAGRRQTNICPGMSV